MVNPYNKYLKTAPMTFKKIQIMVILLSVPLLWNGCKNDPKNAEDSQESDANKKQIVVPQFNADSAYQFIKKQVDFGPRVPNTEAHVQAANYLTKTLQRFKANVLVQEFQQRAYNGTVLNGKNIIGQYNPQAKKRVLLASHWDSRPYADHDANEANHHPPIDGANDGASGVGVLLEMARLMAESASTVGVDIVFFDLEDYGIPAFENESDNFSWALGSQYWAKNPLPMGYSANYGILLDMVGASDATFKMEHYSMFYAPEIVRKVWRQAGILGYGSAFIMEDGGMVMDDHIPVNEFMKIPMIDIIHYDQSTESGFFPHWHTITDNIEQIDKTTLLMVGETVMHVVYNE